MQIQLHDNKKSNDRTLRIKGKTNYFYNDSYEGIILAVVAFNQ